MAVHLRQKELKNGLMSLYLDYYPPTRKKDGTLTRREFLNRTVYKKPKNPEEKQINKENLNYANSIRLKREKGILNEEDGIFDSMNKKMDFLKYFNDYIEDRKQSKGSYDNHLGALHYLQDFTKGKCNMGDLTEGFCNRFKNYLLSADRLNTVRGLKLSQNSAMSYFNKFRSAVNDAFDNRLISDNPLKHIKGIAQKESKREFLTQEELQKLVQTDCDLPIIKTACLFSALTGLRWSDLSSLKWKDIQHTEDKGYFLHITQRKTQDVIMHPINDKAVQILGTPLDPNEIIFYGLKYNDSNNDRLKRWVLKAGIEKKITLHNFRHTYATLILNKGADIFTVSKLLGHKNIRTTMIYAKILTETKVTAANLIDIDL
ncbi:MAG: site-specific integrase [Bacteroidetes bacterium]|nr:site-specific integrase [Bacteroidota bacterium]